MDEQPWISEQVRSFLPCFWLSFPFYVYAASLSSPSAAHEKWQHMTSFASGDLTVHEPPPQKRQIPFWVCHFSFSLIPFWTYFWSLERNRRPRLARERSNQILWMKLTAASGATPAAGWVWRTRWRRGRSWGWTRRWTGGGGGRRRGRGRSTPAAFTLLFFSTCVTEY